MKALTALRKAGAAVRMGNEITSCMSFVSTGSLLLNRAIGQPGYPCGLLTEIYGEASNGKSLLTLIAEGIVTRQKKYVLHIDAEKNHEHAETNEWRKAFGVDLDYVIQQDADTAERIMENTLTVVEHLKQDLALIVCDSINALVPSKILESEMGDANIANQARLLHKWFDLMRVKNKYAAFLCINQTVASITRFGGGQSKGGGNAMKFDPHLSLEVKGSPIIDAKSDIEGATGMDLTITVKKNKLGPAKRVAETSFKRELGGFDIVEEVIDIAVENGYVKKTAGWYEFKGKKFNGKEKFRSLLVTNRKALEILIKQGCKIDPKELGL